MAVYFKRRKQGSAFIELGITLSLMIVLAGLASDITLMVFAMFLDDKACRDAARAAAQQTTSAAALQAAQVQLQIHATDGVFVGQPTLVSQTSPNFVYNDYLGNPPNNQSPYVTVTISTNIKLPAPIFFWGTSFMTSGSLNLIRRYTYPIVKEKFYG
jgi:Flp pilus assembly protein TadG